MDMERFAYITIVILASFGLGFWIGNAYATSKYTKKQKKLTRRIQVLENFKHAVKVLCPKIKDDEHSPDYLPLPKKINGKIIVAPFEDFDKPVKNIEDDDTKAGELEIVTKGHPDDA